MYYFYILFIFFIIINLIYSFIHVTLYIFCDDYCISMYLDNTLLDFNKLNYNPNIPNYFQKINFTANPGQKLTIISQNYRGYFGIAAKIIFQSNGYIYI